MTGVVPPCPPPQTGDLRASRDLSPRPRLVTSERHVIAELAGSGDPLFADVGSALDGNPELKQSLTGLPQVLHVSLSVWVLEG